MRNLIVLFVLVLIVIAGLGFYQGWFRLSTEDVDQNPSATISVDKEKILEDEQSVRDSVSGFGQGAKKNTGQQTDEVK